MAPTKQDQPVVKVGQRVVKVKEGRAIPIGTEGTVGYIVGEWVGVRFDTGEMIAVRLDSLELVTQEEASGVRTPRPKEEPIKAQAEELEGREAQAAVWGFALLFLFLGFLGSLLWLGISYLSIYGQPDRGPRLFDATTAVAERLYFSLPDAVIRLEARGGNNLDIYLSRNGFESVLYPDRKAFVSEVGKAWCDRVDKSLLPSVKFYDIRSGRGLASYSCTLSIASLD